MTHSFVRGLIVLGILTLPGLALGAEAEETKAPGPQIKVETRAAPTQRELELSKALLETQKQNLELQYQRLAEQMKQVQDELDKRAADAKAKEKVKETK